MSPPEADIGYSFRVQMENLLNECNSVLSYAQKLESNVKLAQQDLKSAEDEERSYVVLHQTVINVLTSFQMGMMEQISQAVNTCLDMLNLEHKAEFKIAPTTIRNSPGLKVSLLYNGEEFDLDNDSGDGLVEAIAFALRVACLSVSLDSPRKILILDEPFKHLSEQNVLNMADFVKGLSESFGIQFLIISHDKITKAIADKVFDFDEI